MKSKFKVGDLVEGSWLHRATSDFFLNGIVVKVEQINSAWCATAWRYKVRRVEGVEAWIPGEELLLKASANGK